VPAEAFAGYLDVLNGRAEEGIGRVRRALADACTGEAPAPGVPGFLARTLLEACATAGEAEAGLSAADAALGMGRGAELWEAETRRLRADFLVALGAAAEEVEAELLRAIAVAEDQATRTLELRAREDLDRFRAERSEERSQNGVPPIMPSNTDGDRRPDHRR
jgi:hypothetical protein